jgi:predicted nucleotidyltransferase
MSTSPQSFKVYSFAQHTEVYHILERVFASHGISYYLIGANARDIALYKAGENPGKATADIDFAVMVPDHASFVALKTQLIKEGFEGAGGTMPHRLHHSKSKTIIDLLPYGQIAQKYTVSFMDRKVELSTIGFNEVGTATEVFESPGGISIPVSPAHGLVILKLIAFSEKPERTKDLTDIAALLKAAWPLYEPEFFATDSAHADLFNVDDFDMATAAARLMGRKMRLALLPNKDLLLKIALFLETDYTENNGPLSLAITKALDSNLENSHAILKALHKGLIE